MAGQYITTKMFIAMNVSAIHIMSKYVWVYVLLTDVRQKAKRTIDPCLNILFMIFYRLLTNRNGPLPS